MQQVGSFARLILKVIFVLIVIRILMYAAGLKIFEYVPVIDDLIEIIFRGMQMLAGFFRDILDKVVKM